MDIMRCCPWVGSVDNLLNTVPCPPPMMNFSEFRTFVLDQNITQSEFTTIASKCNLFDMDTTTSHASITTAVDRNITSYINIRTTKFAVTSQIKEVTTAENTEIGSDMRIVIGVTCGSIALILIFVILLIQILLKQTFVLDQNITMAEYNIVARKCNVLNMGATTTEITSRPVSTTTSTIHRTRAEGLTTSHMTPVVTGTAPTNSSYEGLVIGVVCGAAAAIILIILLVWIIRKKARTEEQSQNKMTIDVQVCVSVNSHQRSSSTSGSKSFESTSKERTSENKTLLETLTNNKSSESVIFQNERKKETNDTTPTERKEDNHCNETFGNKLDHTNDIVTLEKNEKHAHDSVATDELVYKSVTVDNNTKPTVSCFEENQRVTQTTYL